MRRIGASFPIAVIRSMLAAVLVLMIPSLSLADRVALVIGNASYVSVAPLSNPLNDAGRVAEALSQQGFDVLAGTNLSRDGMRDTLREFRDMADRADIALVYYAGHGIEIGGENYLVPIDARLADERDADLEMINLDQVLDQISGAGQMKMVVLDACRNNPFVAKVRSRSGSRSIGQGLGDIKSAGADTLIAYAAAAGAVTPDGRPGANSPFTAAFLDAMSGPPVDVRRMLGVVRDRMRQTVPDAAPFVYTSLGGGEFIINPQSARREPEPEPVAEAPAAQTPNPISKDFVETDASGTVAAWDAFLVTYEPQNTHPLYSFALQRRQALLDAAEAERQQQALTARVAEEAVAQAQAEAEARQKAEQELRERQESAAREREVLQAAIDKLERENAAARAAAAAAGAALPADAVAVAPMPETEDEAARQLQTLLKGRGCYSGAIDGQFGRGSTRGLARFLEAAGSELAARRNPPLEEYLAFISVLHENTGTRCQARAVSGRPASQEPKTKTPAPETVGGSEAISIGGPPGTSKAGETSASGLGMMPAWCKANKQHMKYHQDCQ